MFCRPVILCLLNCTTETNQVTEFSQYFSLGPHVDHPWYILWSLLMCNCPPHPGIISPSVQSIVPLLLVWFWYDFTLSTKYYSYPPDLISPSVQSIVPLLLIWFHPQYKVLSPSSWYDFSLSTKYCPHPSDIISPSPSAQSIVPLLVWFHPQYKLLSSSSWYDFILSTKYYPHPSDIISPSVQSIVPIPLILFPPQYKVLSPRLSLVM